MNEDIFLTKDVGQKIKINNDFDWVESSYGKYSWGSGEQNSGNFVGKSIAIKKILTIKIFTFFILFALLLKSFFVQIAQGAKYKELADGNRIKNIPVLAERGIIYDRNKKRLVYNFPDFYLAIAPNYFPKNEEERILALQKISKIINMPPQEIEERLLAFATHNYQSLPIKTGLTYEQAIHLEILSRSFPGIYVENGIKRQYDIPESMSHILGFLRKIDKDELESRKNYLPTDDIGKAGIELQYEDYLRGKYGKKQVEVDALGRQVVILAKVDPVSGQDITLTIDADLQNKVETVLKKHMRAHGVKKASIIISDANTGEILAMVSEPSYDNNVFSGGLSYENYSKLIQDKNKPMFNRSIAGEYPSGSTIKMIFASAALEENIIKEDSSFLSSGGLKVNQWFFPDWKVGGHGATNIKKALAESVNTFFYIIGGGLMNSSYDDFIFQGLGVLKLVEYAKKFGLGEKLEIDLPGESDGFLPSKEWKEKTKGEPWYIGDTYHLAIGQGDITVTPLQVNFYTSVFANRGTLYKPHIVKSISQTDGSVKILEPEVLNKNFISSANIEITRKGLRDGVLYGSSRALYNLPISVAGKTGTAQWNSIKKPHAWFTGFAPYDNPEIVITVLAEEAGEGSAVAVPIAKEILWWYFLDK